MTEAPAIEELRVEVSELLARTGIGQELEQERLAKAERQRVARLAEIKGEIATWQARRAAAQERFDRLTAEREHIAAEHPLSEAELLLRQRGTRRSIGHAVRALESLERERESLTIDN